MAVAIKSEFNVDSKLIEGGGGIFDVKVDGEMIFCKKDVGRFPEDTEVLEQLRAKTG